MYRKIFSLFVMSVVIAPSVASASVFDGKIIGLDAGHNDSDVGAVGECIRTDGQEGFVNEVDVNRAVREELTLLIDATTTASSVYAIAQLDSRSDRVADAEANGSDLLISIHHNGSTNTKADYTQFFVTQPDDKELANVLYPFMTNAIGIAGRGIKNDGYGMTVYGSLPGVLTESYFITNTEAACDFIDYQNGAADTRVEREAQALFDGLVAYLSGTQSNDGGGNGGGKGNGRGPNK